MNDIPSGLIELYSTDKYRATLPIFLAAIARQITKSYLSGVTAAEVVWWWLGAIGTFALARAFISLPAAYCAGFLTCASSLGVGQLGAATLHTASTLSVSFLLVIAWRTLNDDRIEVFRKTAFYGVCAYLSSITYTYQWFSLRFSFS